jgi:hypothetical protein
MPARPAEIDLPRVVDRDNLLFALHTRGFDVEPLDGDQRSALAVRADEPDLLSALEEWLATSGAPLVPERMSKTKYLLRPVGD